MERELADYFYQVASEEFGFVVTKHGFAAPRLRIENDIDFAFVEFIGKNLAIECILDRRGVDITCKIARVIGGKITPCYAMDDKGHVVRKGLYHLLTKRGVQCRFTQGRSSDLKDQIRIRLSDFAEMLRTNGGSILKDDVAALE